MKTFKVISMLLMYPESDWLSALPEMHAALLDEAGFNGNATARLAPLFDLLHESELIALQENYVATFDRNPSHSLHLFEHIHGESRDRGSAMIASSMPTAAPMPPRSSCWKRCRPSRRRNWPSRRCAIWTRPWRCSARRWMASNPCSSPARRYR